MASRSSPKTEHRHCIFVFSAAFHFQLVFITVSHKSWSNLAPTLTLIPQRGQCGWWEYFFRIDCFWCGLRRILRIFFVAYFSVLPGNLCVNFSGCPGWPYMDKALKAKEFQCHCIHLYKWVRAARKSLAEATKEETMSLLAEVALADVTLTCLPLHHLQEITSVSGNRTTIQEVCQKPQCSELMSEEYFLHSLWKHKIPLRMLSKIMWVSYFGIRIINKIIYFIKITTTLTNHS